MCGKFPVNSLSTINADMLEIWVVIIQETLPLVEKGIVDLEGDGGLFPGSNM